MKRLFGDYLRLLRGELSRAKFAKLVGLSYTFVREMELGNRLPSDEVLLQIAGRLEIDQSRLVLYTHCDRSPPLREVLDHANLGELWEPGPLPLLEKAEVSEPDSPELTVLGPAGSPRSGDPAPPAAAARSGRSGTHRGRARRA